MRRLIVVSVTVVALLGTWPANAAPRRLGAAVAPLRLEPRSDVPISVAGLHRYFGIVKIGSFGDGLTISNRLGLEKYLLGLQEVPSSWPEEALKAQAVAARTYALWTVGRPPAGAAATYGFDICATVQCQVFAGADVALSVLGGRWSQAVRDTARQAMFYRGQPILSRYHSTSGGQTLDNPQAFPGEPDYPYLRSVASPTEQASPLFRWRTRFSAPRLQAILESAGIWSAAQGRLIGAYTTDSDTGLHYPDVVIVGRKGRHRMTAEELRDIVRDTAPALYPDLYPSAAPTTAGTLPETFPSNRIVINSRNGVIRVVGRGWGHGVGMSQWGAHGLAERGFLYPDILGHYYTSVTLAPAQYAGPIEVGVAWGSSATTATGSFRIVDGRGRTLVKRALGSWGFSWAGTGAVAVSPPRGFGLPLRVGIVDAPKHVSPHKVVRLVVALSKPARVRTVGSGRAVGGEKVVNAGRRVVNWRAPAKPGTYKVRVKASVGRHARRSEPVRIAVRPPPSPTPSPEQAIEQPAENEEGRPPLWLLFAAIALGLFAVAGALVGRIKR